MRSSGSTYIAPGVVWGMRTLSSTKPFTQGLPYSQMDSKSLRKVIIIMTDGSNTAAKNPRNHYHDNYNRAASDKTTLDACKEAKNSKMELYTISFGNVGESTKKLMQNCASDASNYYDASNAHGLREAFEAIAGGLAGLYLSK